MISETGGMPVDNENKRMCPYLGLKEDPSTALGYPTIMNFCNRASPPQPPTTVHQRAFCLAEAHQACRVFLSQQRGPLPKEIRAHGASPVWYVKPWKGILAAALVLLLAFIIWQVSAGDFISKYLSKASPTSTITSTAMEITRTRTPSPTESPSRTKTPTQPGTATLTPTPTLSATPDRAKTATAACVVFRGAFPGTPCP
jgi:hypothetical protein